jgi:hypothetical protein
MKKLLPVFVALAVVFACSTAWAGWAYVVRSPGVVYRPVVPVVTYYAPAVPVAPATVVPSATVVAPAPVVPSAAVVAPAPVTVPTPVLTPQALYYPGTVVYPAPAVRARVYYRPVRPLYAPAYGVIVP